MKRWFSVLSALGLIALFVFVAGATPAYTSTDTGKVRIWVEFSPGSKAGVQKALNRAGAQFHYEFDELNAFVVSLPESALRGIQNNPNVLSIEEDAIRYPMGNTQTPAGDIVPYGVDMVQARQIWDNDGDGAVDSGILPTNQKLVCIIDSGLLATHEDLPSWNVVGGYPSGYNNDTCGHGSHVAGTINAVANGKGVIGVNPGNVPLYIIQVFSGESCAWSYASTLVDASNRCAAAGAKIISMSLGGAKSNRLEERAFNTHYSNGILNIAAAGNEGTSAYNYPASYSSVMSVAAIDETMTVADFSQFNDQVEVAAPGVAVLSTIPYIATNTLTVDGATYSGNHIEFAAQGSASGQLVDGGLCTATGPWNGKIVLCQRGDIDFYTKVMNVQNSGGTAAVIYNNVPGGFLGTLGEGNSSSIIAISLSQEDGLWLVANKLGSLGSVYSNVTWGVSGYEAWDGTSMATPHVSGVAALIWGLVPNATNVQIRNALTTTARDLGTSGRDPYYGFGLVQAYAAATWLGWGTPPPPTGVLNVTVTTNAATYLNKQTATITATVKDQNGVPVSGASVTFTIKSPTGVTVATSTTTTNTSGVATTTYRIDTKKGKGTYTVTATATKDGYTSGTGTVTFVVQ